VNIPKGMHNEFKENSQNASNVRRSNDNNLMKKSFEGYNDNSV
jgi:hypothetical protein